MKESKFYIFDIHHEPLCYDDCVLEFDTPESAEEFILGFKSYDYQELNFDNALILEEIYFHDGDYLDATNLMVKYDELTGMINSLAERI